MTVAANDNALLTVAEMRAALGITGTTQDDLIQECINRASDEIETVCGRPLVAQEYARQRLPAQTHPHLRPPATPIDPEARVLLSLDGTALSVWRKESDGDPADFDVILGADLPGPPSYFVRPAGWRGATPFPILATYTGGFDPLPGDLKQAALLTVQVFHRHAKGMEPYTAYPAGATGGAVAVRTDTIPMTARELLAPYIRRRL